MRAILLSLAACLMMLAATAAYGDEHDEGAEHVEFDGHDARLHVPVGGGFWQSLNSALDATQAFNLPSRLHGHREKAWTLTDGDGLLAVTGVRWHDTNPHDYLAGGWWMEDDPERLFHEVHPFIDGPELRGALPDTMRLPLSGQAAYSGNASGFWQSESEDSIVGAAGVGGFSGDAELTAHFAEGYIDGCIGCEDGIAVRQDDYNLETGEITFGTETSQLPILFRLFPASFIRSPDTLGTFWGDMGIERFPDPCDVAACADPDPGGGMERPPGMDDDVSAPPLPMEPPEIHVGHGWWRGRFSNVADYGGKPRLAAGTLRGYVGGNHPVEFHGTFSAESFAYRLQAAYETSFEAVMEVLVSHGD